MARYQHNCDACIPLGEFDKFDLYACKAGGVLGTSYIARYGSDGPEYASVPYTILRRCYVGSDRLNAAGVAMVIAYDRDTREEVST